MLIFGHSIGWCVRYLLVVLILGITYDQLERILLQGT